MFNLFSYYRNKAKSCDGKKRDEKCVIDPKSTNLLSGVLESIFFIKESQRVTDEVNATTVDGKHLTCDEAGFIGCKEQGGVSNLFWFTNPP